MRLVLVSVTSFVFQDGEWVEAEVDDEDAEVPVFLVKKSGR